MRIFMVRHGQTGLNRQRRYVGQIDDPLCPEGVRTVRQKGCYPDVGRVYTSALARTQQTARLLFPHAAIAAVPAFNEQCFGDFQGRCYDEIKKDPRYAGAIRNDYPAFYPNGETTEDVMARVCPAFERVVLAEQAAGAKTLVIVAHCGTIISVMMRYALETRDGYYDWNDVGNVQGRAFTIDAALPPADWCIETHDFLDDLTCFARAPFSTGRG